MIANACERVEERETGGGSTSGARLVARDAGLGAGPDPFPGEVIAGRFRLDRPLGKGGMGSVWAAWHLGLNVEVALKFIDPAFARGEGEGAALHFAREAQAAARAKGPHVVNVLDYGADEAGRPYLAMELLQGHELARLLERAGRLPPADVCRIVVHACRGLARAHAAGIVHRDLKPENLFLVDDEDEGFVVKVLDFGIAQAGGPARPDARGRVLGTPLYMSPEQASGRDDVDFRSDLYSLGVVAFRCLTGELPFAPEGPDEPGFGPDDLSPPTPRPDLPPALEVWLRRALQRDPARRFASAREMADAFATACGLPSGKPPPALTSWRPRPHSDRPPAPSDAPTLTAPTPPRPRRAPRVRLCYASAFAFGVLVSGLGPCAAASLARHSHALHQALAPLFEQGTALPSALAAPEAPPPSPTPAAARPPERLARTPALAGEAPPCPHHAAASTPEQSPSPAPAPPPPPDDRTCGLGAVRRVRIAARSRRRAEKAG